MSKSIKLSNSTYWDLENIAHDDTPIEDTGWVAITFTSNYWSARTGYEPKYRKIGKMVFLVGQFIPSTNLSSFTNYSINTTNLPMPTYQYSFLTGIYSSASAAIGWIANNSITIRPYSAISSSENVGVHIDSCYLTD